MLNSATIPQSTPKHFFTGDWKGFFKTVKQIALSAVKAPSKSPLDFNFTIDAVQHNSNILKDFNFDLEKLIQNSPGSTISYGSELRPIDQLEPLLIHHPTWKNSNQTI